MSRKTVVTFNLPVALVERMDEAIERGQRSAFAERALESALGKGDGLAPLEQPDEATSAQTRTPEESSRSSSEPALAEKVGETAKESASPVEPAKRSGGPRRSTDVKKGVKPIPRST